ncbi:MAG: DMT family transporter [Oscillospiraceae bacterium]
MKKTSDVSLGYIAIIATSILWSLGGLFIKLIPWSPLSINAARCGIALLLKIAMRRSVKFKPSKTVIAAGVCFFLTTVLFSCATKLTTSANAILLQFTSPIFIILFTWIKYKRKPSGYAVLTFAIIFAGIFLCFLDNAGLGNMFGNALAILSGFFFGAMVFLNALPDADPDSSNMLGFFIGFVFGLPWLLGETQFSVQIGLCVLVLGAFQLGLAYIIFEYGIRRVPALTANFLMALEPILNPIWVAVFYHESIGAFAIIGGALVVIAVLFYSTVNARLAKRSSDAVSLDV